MKKLYLLFISFLIALTPFYFVEADTSVVGSSGLNRQSDQTIRQDYPNDLVILQNVSTIGNVQAERVLVNAGSTTTPSLAFGDGDTGLYETTDDDIGFSITGITRARFNSAYLWSNITNGFSLQVAAATSTVPAFAFSGDIDTGMGRAAEDQVSIIAGAEEVLQLGTGGSAKLRAGDGSDTAQLGGILDVNTTQYSTPADTAEHDAITYTLPANTLNTDGKVLRVKAWGKMGATANAKNIRSYFGAATIASLLADVNNNKGFMIESIIVRTGVGTQKAIGSTPINLYERVNLPSSLVEDETGTIVIKVTAQNGVATAGDIVFEGMIVELLN